MDYHYCDIFGIIFTATFFEILITATFFEIIITATFSGHLHMVCSGHLHKVFSGHLWWYFRVTFQGIFGSPILYSV